MDRTKTKLKCNQHSAHCYLCYLPEHALNLPVYEVALYQEEIEHLEVKKHIYLDAFKVRGEEKESE